MNALAGECGALCRYLVDRDADDYVVGKYEAGHRAEVLGLQAGASAFDRLLLRVGLLHPLMTRAVDGYAALLFKRALLRKKVTLLIAILETRPPFSSLLDRVDDARPAALVVRMLIGALPAILIAVVLAVVFIPLQLSFGVGAVLRGRAGP